MATLPGWLWLALLVISFMKGSSGYIADASFSPIVTVSELNWGLRTAYTSCDLSFPSISMLAGSTFIYTRFNVRVLDFVHYVSPSPDAVQMDPSLKWLVVSADFNYNGVLNYGFQFNYGEFLGTGKPTGDCAVFANLTEALEFGAMVPELTVTETDRFVSNTSFLSAVVESSDGTWTSIAASCQAQLGDITLGLYEAYTHVNFGMPVYNAYSAYGTSIVDGEDGSSWVLGRYPTHGVGFINELYRFRVPSTADPLYEDGYCSVYAVTNDTLPSLIGTLHQSATTTSAATTTTTTTSTTTGTPATSTTTASTTTDIPSTTSTPSSTTTTTASTTTDIPSTTSTPSSTTTTTASTTTDIPSTTSTPSSTTTTTASTTTDIPSTTSTPSSTTTTTASTTTDIPSTTSTPSSTTTTTTDATTTTTDTTVPSVTTTSTAMVTIASVPIPSTCTPASTPVSSSIRSISSTSTNGHTYEIMGNFAESGLRRAMQESSQMRNQMITGIDELWHLDGSNLLTCGRRCLVDACCLSIFYSADTRRCFAHSSVYTKGDTVSNFTVHYVIV